MTPFLISFIFSFVPYTTLGSVYLVECSAIFIYSHKHSKLDPRPLKSPFIDCPSNKKRCECFHLKIRHIFIFMDVTFYEKNLFMSSSLQGEKNLK